jgi:adenosine kinase
MVESVDVLGLGNSLVDIIAETDDAYLQAQDMVKGAMTLIDEERAEALYAARVAPRVVSGGSAANTIVGVASFGVSSAYIGKVKADDLGRAFIADLRSTGVVFDTAPAEDGPATGRCLVYVTPDGERTMNTFLGASSHLAPPDVDEAVVRAARIVYLEGYMWDRPAAKSAFLKAGEIARAANRRVALTLSDSFCVDRFRGEFIDLMRRGLVDTLFANSDEILSLYQTPSLDEALDAARREGVLAAVTRSEKGSVVVEGRHTYEVPAFPIARLADTTGAGDLYAAGFLAGLARGADLEACAALGALAAAEIIQHLGARPEAPLASLARDSGLAV